jgi:hypothetical protein
MNESTNRAVIVKKFTGTDASSLQSIADSIAEHLNDGFVLAAQVLAYYTSPSTNGPTAVTLLTFVK